MCYKSSRIIAGNQNQALSLAACCCCGGFFFVVLFCFCCCCFFLGNEGRKGWVIVTRGRKVCLGTSKIKSLPLRRRRSKEGGNSLCTPSCQANPKHFGQKRSSQQAPPYSFFDSVVRELSHLGFLWLPGHSTAKPQVSSTAVTSFS